mmetsp:Transcript_39629/g.62675  ORF Transcript_39629/g.62675 Transcript_39629/m.62675 type:complete len:211 (-) Transcript_39629:510-1142(-)
MPTKSLRPPPPCSTPLKLFLSSETLTTSNLISKTSSRPMTLLWRDKTSLRPTEATLPPRHPLKPTLMFNTSWPWETLWIHTCILNPLMVTSLMLSMTTLLWFSPKATPLSCTLSPSESTEVIMTTIPSKNLTTTSKRWESVVSLSSSPLVITVLDATGTVPLLSLISLLLLTSPWLVPPNSILTELRLEPLFLLVVSPRTTTVLLTKLML